MTPRLLEATVRLGSLTSYAEASEVLRQLLRVRVPTATVRRLTTKAGAVLVQHQEQASNQIRMGLLAPKGDGVDLQQVSVDGAMVPLLHGQFAEVRTVAIGTVRRTAKGPHAEALSYFSRLSDHERFCEQARIEFFERKTELAKEVVAVTDGAEWIQDFLDEHCPSALRIIDWGHAAGYLSAAGQALYGAGTVECAAWLEDQRAALWKGDPQTVVNELARLKPGGPEAVRVAHQYLEKRLAQIQYAGFRDRDYPVGSGIVESANKAVVEARLKGRGRHWAPDSVNPMLALRCAAMNDRWVREWSHIHPGMAHQHRRRARPSVTKVSVPLPQSPQPASRDLPQRDVVPPKTINGVPTIHHPWKSKLRRLPKL